MLPLLLLGAWALARAAGPVLLVFIVAGLIALLLNPFVTLLRRAHFPRGAAVATVYLVLLLAVAGIGVLLANPVANQVSAFRDEVPSIVDGVNDSLANVQDWLDSNGVDLQVPSRARPRSTRSATASRRAPASWSRSRATRCCGWRRRRSR